MRNIGFGINWFVCTQLEWPAVTLDIIDNPYIINHNSGNKNLLTKIMKKAQKRR